MKKLIVTRLSLDRNIKKSCRIWKLTLVTVAIIVLVNLALAYYINFVEKPIKTSAMGAIVRIVADNKTGTGFFVTDSYILTAAHVAGEVGESVVIESEKAGTLDAKVVASGFREWSEFVVNETEVRSGATEYDWAVLKIEGSNRRIKPLHLGSADIDAYQGATVYLAGHPQGQSLTLTKGIISRVDSTGIYTDSEVDPGFSGGPMIVVAEGNKPESGVVVGILISVPKNMNSIKTAVPIDVVMENCRRAGINIQ
ncbi:MAG: serine protease [Acidobacteriota bacterium]|nr:serine protease [Acidobacteriota bacterium]